MVELAQLKEDVARITRHDMMAPLAGVSGIVHVPFEDSLVRRQLEQFRLVEDTALRELNIINLSAELLKIEAGRVERRAVPVKVGDILWRIAEINRNTPSGKDLTSSMDTDVSMDMRDRFLGRYATSGKVGETGPPGTCSARLLTKVQLGSTGCRFPMPLIRLPLRWNCQGQRKRTSRRGVLTGKVEKLLAIFLCAIMGVASAENRPKIGLVLGGGGARGAAHIGVLEELERLRIPVDCVAGTSMGALVAGAWVAGRDAASLRREMAQADWNDLFQDNPGYNDIAYRNKRFDKRFLPGSEVGVTAQGLVTPPGVVLGQKIKLFFNQLVGADAGERLLEHLPTPLSIVATDIGTGERVVLRDGSLSMAMRASMAVPGLMTPLEYQGRKLVDGGLVDNLPIQEVRERCGAEVVIAVNVGSPMLPASEVSGLLTVSTQVISILTEQNVTRSLAALRPTDIYIKPDLTGITAAQFDRAGETADRGLAAAQAAKALQRLSVSNAAYQSWRQAHAMRVAAPPTVDAVEIAGLRAVNPAAVSRHIHQELGQPLDTAQLQRDLLRVYGDGDFERVDYRLSATQGHTTLHIDAVEKPWGPNYARLGLNLNTTLTGRSTYSLRGAYQKAWINALGGELLFTAELGTHTGLGAEWYQPLETTQQYFGFTAATLRRENLALFANDLRIADYRASLLRLDAALGRNLGLTGQLRLGVRSEHQSLAIETGLPLLPTEGLQTAGTLLSWESDLKNQLHIATTGWSGKASWYADLQGRYDLLSAQLDGAWAQGPWVLGSRASYVGSTYGVPPVQHLGRLGGFLNLSGYASDQLMGNGTAYAHVRAERILGRMPTGLTGDLRVGLALEYGKVAEPVSEPGRTGLLNSLVIYLRGETPFGPAYVALGRSATGQTNAYLFIGTP